MKNHHPNRYLRLVLLALTLASVDVFAQNSSPPGYMTYQGFVTDANGIPLATNAPGNYDLQFRLYSAQTGGTPLWGESQTVTVDRGYFSVLLGQGAALSGIPWSNNLSGFFIGSDASDRYLGLTAPSVSANEIQPRLRMLASPYAFLAQNAVSVSGSNTVTPANLSPSIGVWTTSGNNVYRASGNIGIGTANPSSALQVSGGDINLDRSHSIFSGDNTTFSYSGNTVRTYSLGWYLGTDPEGTAGYLSAWGALRFFTHQGERLTITPDGQVGIGTASPNNTLQVNGGVTASSFAGDGTIPIGGIIMWSGAINAIPDGWALCNGQTASGQQTPNLIDRFIVGAGSTYSVGNTGGAASVTLTVNQLPPHSHTYTDTYATVPHNTLAGGGSVHGFEQPVGSTSRTTGSAGLGQPFDNRPPYYALAYIMRVR